MRVSKYGGSHRAWGFGLCYFLLGLSQSVGWKPRREHPSLVVAAEVEGWRCQSRGATGRGICSQEGPPLTGRTNSLGRPFPEDSR